MRNVTDLTRQVCTLALAAAILSPLPLAAETKVRQVKWEDLSMVTGHTVRISLPGGIVTGKAGTVEADALVVDVQKTSDRNAYPKGTLRVPREKLHRLEMQTKRVRYRVIGTSVGAYSGIAAGAIAATALESHGAHTAAAIATFIGVGTAGTVLGYLAGNQADQRWTTIEILP
jgi:hypothetical protein